MKKTAPMFEVAYTASQAAGGIPNGAVVLKTNSGPGDGHSDGARAVVIGSLGPIYQAGRPLYGYWVRWDDLDLPVFIQGDRIKVP